MMTASETVSGFRPRIWMERLLLILLIEERVIGSVFCDEEQMVIVSGEITKGFVTEVVKIKIERPDLVVCEDEIIWESTI